MKTNVVALVAHAHVSHEQHAPGLMTIVAQSQAPVPAVQGLWVSCTALDICAFSPPISRLV